MELFPLMIWSLTLFGYVRGGPNLLFASTQDFRIVNAARSNQKGGSVLMRDVGEVQGMNFCYELGLICWTERQREVLMCAGFNGTDITSRKEMIVKSNVNVPEGLACDWVTSKIYFTDGEANSVEVISIVEKHQKVLFWDDLDQPRSIALIPQKRIMVWTDWGELPKIERAGMDGSPGSRKAIVTEDVFWPNGVTIDFDAELIYWVDGKLKYIGVVDYDGGKRRKIIPSNMDYPYGISFFRNKIYWTDWTHSNLFETDAYGNTTRKIVVGDKDLLDVRVVDPLRQPPVKSQCTIRNGGCSHLCLLSPEHPFYRCACPTGIKLITQHTCANESQEFLVVAQRSDISRISLDSPDYTIVKLPLHGLQHTIAIDYDPKTGDVYWTDDENHGIRRATIKGTQQRDVIVTDVQHPDGIAIDWISRNLFWTDTGTDRIEVATLQGQHRKVLIYKGLREPRGIAVAPEHGLIFWSDWFDEQPKVERANMDGSDRRRIADKDVAWPNGVALDLAAEKIFWCDAKTDRIESCNFDGSDRLVVVSDRLAHPFGLSLLGDYLYWSDWSQRSIERFNRFSGEREAIAEQIANIMDVRAVRLGSQLGWNPCADNNGGCNHLCLNRPGHNYVCACEIEYELAEDKKTCFRSKVFLLYAREETIGSRSIETNYNQTIPVSMVVKPSGLALDQGTGKIFWTDSAVRAISHAFVNGSEEEKMIEFGLEHPEGIAVDWISKNLYWTDSSARRIEVSRVNGSSRRVLIWRGVDSPYSITLDPLEGYMYWTDWGSSGATSRSVGAIMRAGMDGSRSTVLIANVARASGITIDFKARKLYWASSKPSIEYSNMDGTHVKVLIKTGITKPIGLAQYMDHIYWSDWETGVIEKADKNTGGNRSVIATGLKNVADIMLFQRTEVFHENQCSRNNGGCSHLCFPLPGKSYTCHCPLHYTLAADNRTCKEPTSYLLFSQKNSVHRFLPDTSDCPDMVLPVNGLKVVRAIAFDPVTQLLFWIDGRSHSIRSGQENSGRQHTVYQVLDKKLHLHDLAFDPYSRFLFWSCSSTDVINATRIASAPNSAVDIIVRNATFKPRDLALHPGLGFLFWVDAATKGRIVRSRLDGSNATILIKDLREVATLTVDFTINKIFFAFDEQIDVSELDGSGRKTLIRGASAQILAVLGNYLYWVSGYSSKGVERANKLNGDDRRDFLNRVTPTDIISVTHPTERMFQSHPCSNVNKPPCSHLCLPQETKQVVTNTLVDGVYYDKSEYYPRESILLGKDNYLGTTEERTIWTAQCACPLYQRLDSDGRTCTDIPKCPNKFICSGLQTSSEKDCIPNVWRCDGQKDCPDGSDELGCPSCGPDHFQCLNGQCIDKEFVCDHVRQCSDGSDEARCCQPGEFMCILTSDCISNAAVCDTVDDCQDGSDEAVDLCLQREHNAAQSPDKGIPSYAIAGSLALLGALILPVICYYFHRKLSMSSGNSGESSGVLLSPKPFRDSSSVKTPTTQVTMVSMSLFNSSASSKSYDRNHITGASSSSTSNGVSCEGAYPAETLNPPPSPATIRTDSRRYCGSSGSRYKPYRHYRVINQPPPPTPCETDVCDESDYGYRPQTESEYMSYSRGTASECDSDPFPPPPTPSSCPPSPSSTYWNPLPPPPSPVSRHNH